MNFDTGISSLYVNPLFPKVGDKIKISIFVNTELKIKRADFCFLENGFINHLPMNKNESFYEIDFFMKKVDLRWYFNFQYEEDENINTVYITRFGVQTLLPVNNCAFLLKSNLEEPEWVSSSTCYQVFPDRFKKGDETVGAKNNEYEFDGGRVKVMNWEDPPLNFKEGHCLDFYNGDLKGIEDSIEHFKELGINAVYLNPIASSLTTHRYDCIDFFNVDEKLGGNEAYKRMIETLHKNGIKVITDISINHTGSQNPWFLDAKQNGKFSEFYYRKEDGSYEFWNNVNTLPQLNYSSDKLRDLIYRGENSVMRKFLKKDFGQDGWRLDVANQVGVFKEDNFCKEVWSEVREAVREENSQTYLVGEDWEDSSEFLQGDIWDATMNYVGSGRIIRRWAGERDCFQRSYGEFEPSKERPFTGKELSDNLDQVFDSMLQQMIYFQFNLIDSHDTSRLHNNQKIFDFNIYSGCIMLLYLIPGMPSVYYGDEIGLEGKVDSIENSRYPMVWDKNKWNKDFYILYKNLGKLRNENKNLFSFGQYKTLNNSENSMTFARYNKEKAIVLMLNRNNKESIITIDSFVSNAYYDYFTGEKGNLKVVLPPKTSKIIVIDKPFFNSK